MVGRWEVSKLVLATVVSVASQMIIAWGIDQVIDLNNGLNVSLPLTYNEEVLCLATLFSYSVCTIIVALAYKYMIADDDKDESI
jgi:hypothetical protein